MKKIFLALLLLVATMQVAAQQPVKFRHEAHVNEAEGTIVFYAEIEDGYDMYSTDIPKGGPMPITIRITESEGVEMVGKLTPVTEPKTKYDSVFEMNVSYFTGSAELEQKFKVLGDNYKIKGYLRYQSCGNGGCIPNRYEFTITNGDVSVIRTIPIY